MKRSRTEFGASVYRKGTGCALFCGKTERKRNQSSKQFYCAGCE
ncbi:MAG: hypothetical protein AB7E48_02855 [Deferribacterales bacterium]